VDRAVGSAHNCEATVIGDPALEGAHATAEALTQILPATR
jgi:hypothetical protein